MRLLEKNHVLGVVLACAGSLSLSFGAIAVREIEGANSWQILFYRSIGLVTGALLLFAIRNRGRIAGILSDGFWRGLYAGPFLGVASVFYILSLTHTTVANAMMTFTATPLLVAGIGWLVMREPVRRQTLVAMFFAAIGIAVMSFDGALSGAGIGSLFAICNAIAFAIYFVMLRLGSRNGAIDMLPTILAAATIAGVAGWIGAHDLQVPFRDKAICFLWGCVLQTLGTTLIVTAARFMLAAELSLIVLLESICGPIWVWLLFAEQPRMATIAGGVLTIITMGVWLWFRMQTESAKPAG